MKRAGYRPSHWLKQTAALATLCGLYASTGTAHAQSFLPTAQQPAQDVYSYLAQYSALSSLPLYSSPKVTGQYTSMTVVGDSWADWGNARSHMQPVVPGYNSSLVGANGRYGNALNIIDAVQYHYGIATSAVYNYAVGGATSGTLNNNVQSLNLPGMYYEIQQIVASGARFGWSDMINITSVGGNDAGIAAYGITITPAQTAANQAANMSVLMGLGARNFTLTNAGNLLLNQQAFVPLAQAGARIFLFDVSTLQARITANPGLYGFTKSGEYCSYLGGTGGSCATPPGGNKTQPAPTNASLQAQDAYTMIYQHPTSAMAALIAQYEVNQADGPSTINAQSELTQIGVQAFTNSLFGRLDNYRMMARLNSYANAYASVGGIGETKAAQPANQPFSAFIEGVYQAGKRSDSLFSMGYDYDVEGGMVGLQRQINPNILVGAAFSGTTPHATLNQSQGHIDMQSYQFAGYGSATYPNWFADGILAYGYNKYKLDRPGVLGDQTADTHGSNVSAAARAGYLFDLGSMKAGPIAGLSYTNVGIARYTEQGDYLLNQIVGNQTTGSLTGSVGVQLRLAQPFGAARIEAYLNVTAEHQFLSGDRTILTSQQSTPLIPVFTPILGRGEGTYGKVAAGMSAALAERLMAQVSAVATFAGDGGNDYGISGGLKYQF